MKCSNTQNQKIVIVVLSIFIPEVYHSLFLSIQVFITLYHMCLDFRSVKIPAKRMYNSPYLHDYRLQFLQMVACCGDYNF